MNYQVYLAGGMCNLSFAEQTAWRKVVKDSLSKVDSLYNVNIISPTDYYNFEAVEYRTQREVMEFDLHKVRTSNLIIVNFNDASSIGTAMELAVARENHIPIIGLNENDCTLHPWLSEHCTRVCTSMAEVISHVESFYLN